MSYKTFYAFFFKHFYQYIFAIHNKCIYYGKLVHIMHVSFSYRVPPFLAAISWTAFHHHALPPWICALELANFGLNPWNLWAQWTSPPLNYKCQIFCFSVEKMFKQPELPEIHFSSIIHLLLLVLHFNVSNFDQLWTMTLNLSANFYVKKSFVSNYFCSLGNDHFSKYFLQYF